MKNLKTLILTTAVAVTFNVNAHDPSMHAKKPAKLDCTGYNKMIENGTKMDMTDPVMLAMMKKCKNQKAQSPQDNADGHHDEKSADKKTIEHKKDGEMKCGDSMKKDMKKTKDGNN